MSTETLTKLNPKILINSKFDPNGSDANVSDPKTLNAELNKVELSNNKKNKHKTCINKLNNRLKIQEKNKKIENRVLTGLFLSVVAVLFFVAT
jgi:ABC-type Fe3+-citrate transport system substrate-binding protein